MTILPLLKTALRSMRNNKVRTALTVLGMVIGITSVIIVYSAGEGIRGLFLSQIESFGTDIIEAEIKIPTNINKSNLDHEGSMGIAMGVQITTLNLKDLEDIKKLPNVKDGYAGVMGQDLLTFGSNRKKVIILGASSAYLNVDKSEVAAGRFFTESEDRSLNEVIVIGYKIKKDIFGDSDAIGQKVKLGKNKYEVVGIMKERGASFGMDFDNYVYLPIRTLQKKVMGIDHVMYMVASLNNPALAEETAEEARIILRENHDINTKPDPETGIINTGPDDFRVVTMDEMMKTVGTIMSAITILLLAIVIISLIVGGVGIMNIMYVIVTERTREIGLRKAVGARYHDIMGQFLLESILITILGALVGIVIGIGISYLIAIGARSQGFEWRFVVPIKAFLVAFLFSLLFGIVFGLMPARKAAKMDPIAALRNE